MCACVVIAAERSTRKHTLGTVGQYTNVFVCLLLCKREREREREKERHHKNVVNAGFGMNKAAATNSWEQFRLPKGASDAANATLTLFFEFKFFHLSDKFESTF